jgi:hypothetical protein
LFAPAWATRVVSDNLDRMEEIFLPKDLLPNSAGQVPIFYWFVRSYWETDDQFVRKFLVRFERDRRANRKLVESNLFGQKVDLKLVEYDQFNRNTNDLGSHRGRM